MSMRLRTLLLRRDVQSCRRERAKEDELPPAKRSLGLEVKKAHFVCSPTGFVIRPMTIPGSVSRTVSVSSDGPAVVARVAWCSLANPKSSSLSPVLLGSSRSRVGAPAQGGTSLGEQLRAAPLNEITRLRNNFFQYF